MVYPFYIHKKKILVLRSNSSKEYEEKDITMPSSSEMVALSSWWKTTMLVNYVAIWRSILASWSKCSRMPLWKSQRIMMVMVQVWYSVQTTGTGTGPQTSTNTIYNWHRNRDRPTPQTTCQPPSVTTNDHLLGNQAYNWWAHSQPHLWSDTHAPTTTTPTTTTPVPESAAVTQSKCTDCQSHSSQPGFRRSLHVWLCTGLTTANQAAECEYR